MTQTTHPAGSAAAAGAATPAEAPVAPGTVLAGKYRVERVIGQGGMGVVVEARHIGLDDRVALKFLTASFAQHPEALARFHREGKAAVKIKSEHVARVSDIGTLESGAPYMVMEFLQGQDLSHELQKKGVLTVQDAVDYVLQASEALAEAHSHGIVHRDIKPANLFLTRRHDGSALVKVLDFGISKMAEGVENLTGTMTAMGSALYMSPEQMQQTRGVDHRTDIYALGIALYELLAGKQPYYADTLPQLCAEVLTGTPTPLRQVRPDVPPELAAVLEKAYARDRAHRYSSVAELVVALAPFAPARSQPNIDRVARAAGLTPPFAGASAPAPGGPSLSGGTIAMDVRSPLAGLPTDPRMSPARPGVQPTPPGGYPMAGAGHSAPSPAYPGYSAPSPAHTTSPHAVPAAPPGHPAASPAHITSPHAVPAAPPGHLTASAALPPAHPAPPPGPGLSPGTAPNMVLAAPAPAPARGSKAPLFIGIAVALLGLGAAAFFAFRGAAPTTEPAEPAAAQATSATPQASGAQAPSAAPSDPARAASTPATAPSVSASAEVPPATSGTASAATTSTSLPVPGKRLPIPITKAPLKPTATPKSTTTKPTSVMNER